MQKEPLWRNATSYAKANYRLWRGADGVHIGLNVRLNISARPATDVRAHFMLEKARECIPQIQRFWDRYGVKFDLKFDSTHEESIRGLPDQLVKVSDQSDGPRRSDAGRLYFRNGANRLNGQCFSNCMARFGLEVCDAVCEPVRQRDFCFLLAHESGHWLGLADKYVDEDCPDRDTHAREVDPASPMADFPYDWDGLELFPRHMKSVVGPLCK